MSEKSILAGLNPQQKNAVETTEGPLLVVAGAGSGKTSVLTRRIAYLVEENQVAPWNILAITFTNKAANEMREREQKLLGPAAQNIWMSTFHALCVRILRRDADKIGYSHNFSIADSAEQLTLVKHIEKDLNKIRSKVLIIGINQDQYFPPNLDAIPMHNLIEDSELIIYDSDLGHIGFRELETIEEELSEFMKNFR